MITIPEIEQELNRLSKQNDEKDARLVAITENLGELRKQLGLERLPQVETLAQTSTVRNPFAAGSCIG